MLFQPVTTLRQGLLVRCNGVYLTAICGLTDKQIMYDADNFLADYFQAAEQQEILGIIYGAFGGVFYRHHTKIGATALNRSEHIFYAGTFE